MEQKAILVHKGLNIYHVADTEKPILELNDRLQLHTDGWQYAYYIPYSEETIQTLKKEGLCQTR